MSNKAEKTLTIRCTVKAGQPVITKQIARFVQSAQDNTGNTMHVELMEGETSPEKQDDGNCSDRVLDIDSNINIKVFSNRL
jgi:hypothetical protein